MSEFDASNPKHIRIANKIAERRAREKQQFVAGIMSTVGGRAWMHDILDICSVFTSTFNTNALQMANNEGRRLIGLHMLNQIHAICPDQYIVMMKERNILEVTEDARREQSASDSSDDGAPEYDASGRAIDPSGRRYVDPTDA